MSTPLNDESGWEVQDPLIIVANLCKILHF